MTYDDLVQRINANLNREGVYHSDFEGKHGLPLREVNAWTYWQGVGVRQPKIVVLGQDWGSTFAATNYFKAIDEMITEGTEKNEEVLYFKHFPGIDNGDKDFYTDTNLAKGLARLQNKGESRYPDVIHVKYSDLFFSNLIPGYRSNEKSTGGFKAAWITKQVEEDFRDLLQILSPDVVICLGKDTFERAAKIVGKKKPLEGLNWNQYLDSDFSPIVVETMKKTYLYPMPHPGYFGKMNRCSRDKTKTMYDDWDRLGEWLENHSI